MIQQRHFRLTSSTPKTEFLNRMEANEKEKKKKKDQVRKQMKKEETKECSFRPVTNTKKIRQEKKKREKARQTR